jgi:hypothetical protein
MTTPRWWWRRRSSSSSTSRGMMMPGDFLPPTPCSSCEALCRAMERDAGTDTGRHTDTDTGRHTGTDTGRHTDTDAGTTLILNYFRSWPRFYSRERESERERAREGEEGTREREPS